MNPSNRICYYNGERVFPDMVSNIGFTNNTLSIYSLVKCNCGSIFQNMKSSKFSHIRSAKHKRYFRNNLKLKEDDMFKIYRL